MAEAKSQSSKVIKAVVNGESAIKGGTYSPVGPIAHIPTPKPTPPPKPKQ